MGCDIHMYIEYRNKMVLDNGQMPTWQNFGGRINPGRNYALFALLAGVRNYNNLPVAFPVRGMPDDAGYASRTDNQIYISEEKFDGEHSVTMERAKGWVESNSSKFINNKNGEPTWVTNPDWHSHSWLTTTEFESVFNSYIDLESGWHKERVDTHKAFLQNNNTTVNSWDSYTPKMNIEPEYQAILSSMKCLENLGYEARIVFWFDN